MTTDTPRTDARHGDGYRDVVELARALERDLSAKSAECERLREALLPFSTVPCEYRGNIHCSMIPAEAARKPCAPCAARAALRGEA